MISNWLYVVIIASAPALLTASSCPVGFTLLPETGNCYLVINRTMNQPAAQEACSAMGAHLAFIETEVEQNVIASLGNVTGFPGEGVSRGSAAGQLPLFRFQARSALTETYCIENFGGCFCSDPTALWPGGWIGGCRINTDSTVFVWTSSCTNSGPSPTATVVPMNYTRWNYGEPNNYRYNESVPPGEYCVELYPASWRFEWNDQNCDYWRLGYSICETSPLSESTPGLCMDDNSGTSLVVIVGVTLGAFNILLIAILIIICIIYCKRKRRKSQGNNKLDNAGRKLDDRQATMSASGTRNHSYEEPRNHKGEENPYDALDISNTTFATDGVHYGGK